MPRDSANGAAGYRYPRGRNPDRGRGRSADRPGEIPARGWKDILVRVYREMSEDNLDVIAAGVAFYAFLAIFPGLATLVSLYGLFADPADLQKHLNAIASFAPPEVLQVVDQELTRLAEGPKTGFGIGVIVGILLTLWSATKGIKTIFVALNVAYDEEEKRGFLRLNGMALLFTAGAILAVIVAIVAIVGVPAILKFVGLGEAAEWAISILRWPILAVVVIFGMGLLYRYGPSRDEPKWRWLSAGAIAAAVFWLVGSMLFSLYVANFADYNATYGSLGTVVVVMMWFYLSAFIILIGAELNAEMEHQTAKDTTEGHPQPMGARRAHVADTVGEAT